MPYKDYMKINGNDQFDLKGFCLARCNNNQLSHSYNIYFLDSLQNQWIPFTNNTYYHMTSEQQPKSDLIVTDTLFSDYSEYEIWKFELVTVLLANQELKATSSLIVYVNQPPKPGMCDITPTNGTTSTYFTIYCADWSDSDGGLVNYTFYGVFYLYTRRFHFLINL